MRIEDLKVGDEFECIDLGSIKIREDYARSWVDYICENRPLVISSIDHCNNFVNFADGQFYVEKVDLKYFKKKEQYTFDDLIDVAKKAVRDRVLESFSFGRDLKELDLIRVVSIDNPRNIFNYQSIKEGIKYIQSLYKETFVIECEKDIRRLSKGAKLTLKNGELITFSSSSDEAIQTHYFNDGEFNVIIPLVALKGATVEQEVSCE